MNEIGGSPEMPNFVYVTFVSFKLVFVFLLTSFLVLNGIDKSKVYTMNGFQQLRNKSPEKPNSNSNPNQKPNQKPNPKSKTTKTN